MPNPAGVAMVNFPDGQSVGDVHVMTFDYFTESFIPDLRSVLTARIVIDQAALIF
ncbi:MAG TPA: hypothetical protein VFP01_08935 [Propionibacteriaceae bacterium]|nr:hypothetical protein [Propionibacteriaceae bacterium]